MGWVIGLSVGYTIVLGILIIYFINRQKRLHEKYGKPSYAVAIEEQAPTPVSWLSYGVCSAQRSAVGRGCLYWRQPETGLDRDGDRRAIDAGSSGLVDDYGRVTGDRSRSDKVSSQIRFQ